MHPGLIFRIAIVSPGPAHSRPLARQEQSSNGTPDPMMKPLQPGVDKISAQAGRQPPPLQRKNPHYQLEAGQAITLHLGYTPKARMHP